MKILLQLKKHGRYFRRPRLAVSEIVTVCRDVAEKRNSGHAIDVFLSPAKAKQCLAAVLRYLAFKDKTVGTVRLRSSKDGRPSPFGFTWDAWQVDRDLRINLVSHAALASIGGGIIYVLDMTAIYPNNVLPFECKQALAAVDKRMPWDSARIEMPKRHAAFGCVKQFVAK